MATLRITEADRDTMGKIKIGPEPRSLADLLPKHEDIRESARPPIHATPLGKREWAALAALVLLCAFIAVYAAQTERQTVDTRTLTRAIPTGMATVAPTLAPAVPTSAPEVRKLPAYAAPGAYLGDIETTRAMTPVARYGDAWVQVQAEGSGLVWLRASDWPSLSIAGLPDREPRYVPPPPPAPVEQPVDVAVIAPPTQPPPAPEAPAEVEAGRMAASGWCSGSHLSKPECNQGKITGGGR